jgi:hypothetical protein
MDRCPQQGLTTYTDMMRLLSMKVIKCYISWTCLKFSTCAQPFIFRNVQNIVIHSFIFEVQNSRKTCPCISKESPCPTFIHISSPKSTLGQFIFLLLSQAQCFTNISIYWFTLLKIFEPKIQQIFHYSVIIMIIWNKSNLNNSYNLKAYNVKFETVTHRFLIFKMEWFS